MHDSLGQARRDDRDEAPGTAGVASAMPCILIVEDDSTMRQYLRTIFATRHFRVAEAGVGSEALVQAATVNPDLVLLDYLLPDMDGLRVTTKLREWTPVPILIISARNDEHAKVTALDAGANDFLTKPFGTGELLARIRVWLRESRRTRPDHGGGQVAVGDMRIDFARRLVFAHNREVRLTPIQYKLFETLMRNAGKILTHAQLLSAVWGPAYAKERHYLRVYMGQLREKFEEDPARPRHLVTETGVGYRLRTA